MILFGKVQYCSIMTESLCRTTRIGQNLFHKGKNSIQNRTIRKILFILTKLRETR